jgi:TRAP transporter TAXI family solute receptor
MLTRRSFILCLTAVMVLSATTAHAQTAGEQRGRVNDWTVYLISGGVTGTYIRIAADLANAFDDDYDLRVLPIVGRGSVRNIEDLRWLRGIDAAIVQSDVLDFYRRHGVFPDIEGNIHYIAKLYDEEVHLLARGEFQTVDDLQNGVVNFGAPGSGTFMTASVVFDSLGLNVDVTTAPDEVALEQLRQGLIDALVFVGGQPLNLIRSVEPADDLRLLPIPADRVRGAYDAAVLDTYPDLHGPGGSVPTVAVSAVLAAYNFPPGHQRYRRLERFVERLFGAFDTLQQSPPFHPKWQEVDLRAEVSGWTRFRPAAEILSR